MFEAGSDHLAPGQNLFDQEPPFRGMLWSASQNHQVLLRDVRRLIGSNTKKLATLLDFQIEQSPDDMLSKILYSGSYYPDANFIRAGIRAEAARQIFKEVVTQLAPFTDWYTYLDLFIEPSMYLRDGDPSKLLVEGDEMITYSHWLLRNPQRTRQKLLGVAEVAPKQFGGIELPQGKPREARRWQTLEAAELIDES
ncbi:hypothetical protein HY025_05220 [Candidatus Daviesbacteria bacterium]|nr:hypothetical protein [Candidatus Daviesbacteria bacterium]